MFCTNLMNIRKSLNITQKQLADMLNISHKTISHWEKGYSEPSIDQLKALKNIFNVEYEDLLD